MNCLGVGGVIINNNDFGGVSYGKKELWNL